MKEVLFAGVDVDDNSFNICIVDEKSNVISTLKSSPNAKSLNKVIRKNTNSSVNVKVCYEATYLGFSLFRELSKLGITCEVIAPTTIPKAPNQRVKTDRVDAIHLAKCYQKGLLASIAVPDAEDEADRDLIRERQSLVEMGGSLKRIIINKCRRLGWNYLQEEGKKVYWTKDHRDWLSKKLKQAVSSVKVSLRTLLFQLQSLQDSIATFDAEILHLSKLPKYEDKVKSLRCFKGIETHTAMGLITEIGDINRFEHPKKLTSYAGLDITEYSSGGKEYRYKITKMGNGHIRKLLVECSQFSWRSPTANRALMNRRTGASKEQIEIADRCLHRLYSKGHRLLAHKKHHNKVKVACAREMIGFIWESLRKAA